MYEIMCYGDSNTWGCSPESWQRFPRDVRWTGVLQRSLGNGYVVIEEGQGGRTTVWDDPVEGGHKNGKSYLIPCLESHKPLDLVILMLGTNDLKKRFSVNAFDIAMGAGSLLEVIAASGAGRDGGRPKTLLLAPPPLGRLSALAEMFEGGAEKSVLLGARLRTVAAERGAAFLDASEIIRSSDIDGVHLEEDEHRKLGQAVARMVKQILTD
jgi:lysophospholipase L1-like esterase